MHNIVTQVYDENINKKKVEMMLNEIAMEHSDSRNGLGRPIRWLSAVCDDEQSAEEYIRKNDDGWYDQLAVRFAVTKRPKTKTHEALLKRRNEIAESLKAKRERIHYSKANTKSAFVTCKTCGSKLSTEYIKSNRCPLCGKDLRPESTLQSIATSERMLKEISEKIRKAEIAYSKKNRELKWLVKIEYHS